MHYVSRELAQQLTDVENDLLIIKMYKFRKFFSQPISLYPLVFLLCKMLKPNAYKCCSNFAYNFDGMFMKKINHIRISVKYNILCLNTYQIADVFL